jgi:hypothetical protein
MSRNGHSVYFSQAIGSRGDETTPPTATATGGHHSDIQSTQTVPSGALGGHNTNQSIGSHNGLGPALPARGQSPEPGGDEFRTSLVTKMDGLIHDFRTEKTTRMETLYQILQVLHNTNINEPGRRVTLEEYMLYIDLIAVQQAGVEHQGLGAGDEQTPQEPSGGGTGDGEQGHASGDHPRNSHMEEAEHLLRGLHKELLQKKCQCSPSESSSSGDDSAAGGREGESNRRKRVYQSQLSCYTTEVAAEAKEVDKNCKKTRDPCHFSEGP